MRARSVVLVACAAAAACSNHALPHSGGDAPIDSPPDISPDAYAPKELVAFGFTKASNPALAADVVARINGQTIIADLPAGSTPAR